MNEIYRQVHDEWQNEQNEYDQETKHGVIREKQLAWENKVRKQTTKPGRIQQTRFNG